MVLPILGAAVGVISAVGGITQQRSNARVQKASIKAQADSIKTQEHLAEIQREINKSLIDQEDQTAALVNNSQRTLGILQNELSQTQQLGQIAQQRIREDGQLFSVLQNQIAQDGLAQNNQTQGSNQLRQQAVQLSQQAEELTTQQQQDELIDRGAADYNDSVSSQIDAERDLLQQTEVTNQLNEGDRNAQLLQRQFNSDVAINNQQAALSRLGILSQTQATNRMEEGINNARQFNDQETNTQSDLNDVQRIGALESQKAQLELAQTTQEANSIVQQRSLQNQSSQVRGPGFASVLSAVGNAGIGLYQAGVFNRRPSPTTAPFNPDPRLDVPLPGIPVEVIPPSNRGIGLSVLGNIPYSR